MKESSFHQMILAEGRAEGKAEGKVDEARQILLRLGRKRFGAPDPPTLKLLGEIVDVERIEALIERIPDASSWEDVTGAIGD